jgi:hypothetical protein
MNWALALTAKLKRSRCGRNCQLALGGRTFYIRTGKRMAATTPVEINVTFHLDFHASQKQIERRYKSTHHQLTTRTGWNFSARG